jgi:Family of unknown function (DUF6338)
VIPETVLGLLLFVGSIGPGFVWVQVAERRRPQQERTAILEAAELSFVGLACTGLSAMAVLVVVNEWRGLGVDVDALATAGDTYLLTEPLRGLGTVLAILALSFGLAYGAARLRLPSEAPILPGFSVWDQVFALAEKGRRAYAALELRDGRRFAGYVHVWDVGTSEENRDLALQAPIKAQFPGAPSLDLDETVHFMTFREDDIRWMTVTQEPPPSSDQS